MGISKIQKSVLILAGITALILAFQNCTKSPRSNGKNSLASFSGGNGTGYDGKPYVLGECPNSNEPQRRVRLTSQATEAEIERDGCVDLPQPYPKVPVSQFNPLLPEGLVIQSQAYAVETLGRRFTRLCSGMDNGRPVQVQFWRNGATEDRSEVLRYNNQLALVARSGILQLSLLGTDPTRYESLETYQGPGAFDGNPLLEASIQDADADVTYYLADSDEFSVAMLSCVLNP